MMTADYSYPAEYNIQNESTIADIVYDYFGNIKYGIPKYSIITMIYNENSMPVIIKEMTVDLTELKVNE